MEVGKGGLPQGYEGVFTASHLLLQGCYLQREIEATSGPKGRVTPTLPSTCINFYPRVWGQKWEGGLLSWLLWVSYYLG